MKEKNQTQKNIGVWEGLGWEQIFLLNSLVLRHQKLYRKQPSVIIIMILIHLKNYILYIKNSEVLKLRFYMAINIVNLSFVT